MRNAVVLGLVAGAFCCIGIAADEGSTPIVGVNAESGDDPMPLGKRLAVEAAEAAGPDLEPLPQGPDHTWKKKQADSGPMNDVAQVKVAVAQLLSAGLDAFGRPETLAERAATTAQRRAEVAQVVERAWAPQSLAKKRAESLDAFDMFDLDPSHSTFRDARYVILEWQGVTVTEDSATATLVGHDDFLNPSGWTSGRREQLQLELVRTGNGVNGWQFLTKVLVFDKSDGH